MRVRIAVATFVMAIICGSTVSGQSQAKQNEKVGPPRIGRCCQWCKRGPSEAGVTRRFSDPSPNPQRSVAGRRRGTYGGMLRP